MITYDHCTHCEYYFQETAHKGTQILEELSEKEKILLRKSKRAGGEGTRVECYQKLAR